jgi:hypothetical protein
VKLTKPCRSGSPRTPAGRTKPLAAGATDVRLGEQLARLYRFGQIPQEDGVRSVKIANKQPIPQSFTHRHYVPKSAEARATYGMHELQHFVKSAGLIGPPSHRSAMRSQICRTQGLCAEIVKRCRSYKSLKNDNVLAEEAVISELVSTSLFPVLRENTAKFAEFSHETRRISRFRNVNSMAYHPNSLSIGSGKSFA